MDCVVDHAQHRRAGVDVAAKLDVVDLRRVAGERRANRRVVEVALCLVERSLGLQVRRKFFERQIRDRRAAGCGCLPAAGSVARPASARRRAGHGTILSKHGIKRIFVINGHHGNIGLLQYVGQNLLSKYAINSDFFYFINYWQMLETGFDHAGEVETSLMMAIHPNLVNMDLAKAGLDTKDHEIGSLYKLGTNMSINNPAGFTKFTKNGIWGNPLNANSTVGNKMLSQVIEKISSLITDPNYR